MPRRIISRLAVASVLVLVMNSVALGAPDQRTIQILDNCDGPSFNAVLGPGACVRPAGLTIDKLFASLAGGGAASWRFAPTQATLAAGGSVKAINRGGEFHTFTEVAAFGGGCVDEINQAMGLTAVPECADAGTLFGTTGVAPGGSLTTAPLAVGTHRFQCLIHPWQRSTISAR